MKVTVFKGQELHSMDFENRMLWHQICEECELHSGETPDTHESYVCAKPVISDDSWRVSPCFAFGLTNGKLYLQRRLITGRWSQKEEKPEGPQPIVEFDLADPEFFEKVHNHVHKGWNPCEPTPPKSKSNSTE